MKATIRNLALVTLMLATIVLPAALEAQSRQDGDETERPSYRSIELQSRVETADGRVLTEKTKLPGDLKLALGSLRGFLVEGLGLTDAPKEPIPYIFHCGGDAEKSDGTCADVIIWCAVIDIDFGCNKYDSDGACTNGGC